MKARLEVIRSNAESGITKIEQSAVYRIGINPHNNSRKAENKVLSTKYRGVFKPLSWVNNDGYNTKTALLKNGDIMVLIVKPASEDAAVTFAEQSRKANGEKLRFSIEKQTRPVGGNITGDVLETNEFTAPNERVAKGTINKDANYANYKDGNWQNLPFNAGSFKTSDNGQTIIVLKELGKAEDTDNE